VLSTFRLKSIASDPGRVVVVAMVVFEWMFLMYLNEMFETTYAPAVTSRRSLPSLRADNPVRLIASNDGFYRASMHFAGGTCQSNVGQKKGVIGES
jgi:uncharacterized membrane protein